MPILGVVLAVGVLHELVVREDSLPVFFVFHVFSHVFLVAKELLHGDLVRVEVLKDQELDFTQVSALESDVDQLVAWFVGVLRHFVADHQVDGLDQELGLRHGVQQLRPRLVRIHTLLIFSN